MKNKILLLPIGVLAIAFAAAGCGGSEPDALSKEAFLKQGNQICVEATKEREAAVTELAAENSKATPEDLVNEAVLPPTQEMVDELDGLGVPKGDEAEVETIITGFEEGIEKVEGNPREALGSDAFKKANEAALEYGLTECAI